MPAATYAERLLRTEQQSWAAWLSEEDEVLRPRSKATKSAPELVKLFGKPAAQVSDAASTTAESDSTASDDTESCGGGSALQAFLGRPKESFRVQHGFVGLTDHLEKDPRRSQSCPPRAMQAARAAPVKPWWSLAPCAVVPCAVASESQQEKSRATAGQVSEDGVTTLLVRNIPSKLPRGELIGALEAIGLGDECDVIWMPFDKASLKWKGFFFINFVRPEAASAFCVAAPTIRFSLPHQGLVPSIANEQGLAAMLHRVEKSLQGLQGLFSKACLVLGSSVLVRAGTTLEATSPQRGLGRSAVCR